MRAAQSAISRPAQPEGCPGQGAYGPAGGPAASTAWSQARNGPPICPITERGS